MEKGAWKGMDCTVRPVVDDAGTCTTMHKGHSRVTPQIAGAFAMIVHANVVKADGDKLDSFAERPVHRLWMRQNHWIIKESS